MFKDVIEMIDELQCELKSTTSQSNDSIIDKIDFLSFNDSLKKIYQSINLYRSIKQPVIFDDYSNFYKTAREVVQWLRYAKENCITELDLFDKKWENWLDRNFIYLINLFLGKSPDFLFSLMKENFNNCEHNLQDFYVKYHSYFKSYWGNLDPIHDDYEVMTLRSKSFHEHWEDLLWLYNKLNDYRSKQVLYAVLLNWIFAGDMSHYEDKFTCPYFDYDIIKCDDNEVFVDLGTYNGDTVSDFIMSYNGAYKRIYCYEISLQNLEHAKRNLSEYKNIDFRLKAVSDKEGFEKFNLFEYSTANFVSEDGDQEIEAVTLDKDIQEKVTFIKADIEGSEQKALLGSRNHIINDKPKLAFSIYHNNEDIWKIARMIDSICPGYTFYMRYHGKCPVASEFILLAVYNDSPVASTI